VSLRSNTAASLDDRYTADEGRALMSGTQALVRLLIAQRRLNEELAATAVSGTQLVGELPQRTRDGVVGFWYGKAPGLDRAADAIRHGNVSGTAHLGGAVALIGDDPMCKSSTLPSSCELMAESLMLPLLSPASATSSGSASTPSHCRAPPACGRR
jgi:indolepyruvate ferredoxin oxidoreductase